jgi:hypothetical protein
VGWGVSLEHTMRAKCTVEGECASFAPYCVHRFSSLAAKPLRGCRGAKIIGNVPEKARDMQSKTCFAEHDMTNQRF